MSNIFIKKKNINNVNSVKLAPLNNKNNALGVNKHFLPAVKEWHNSIYAYNKDFIKVLPVWDKKITKLIKSYFNFFHPLVVKKNKKVDSQRESRFKRFVLRLKRLSSSKIFVSRVELKHTNSKIIATLYTYNMQERYLVNKIKKLDLNMQISNKVFLERIKLIKSQGLKIVEQVAKEKVILHRNIDNISNKINLYETQMYKSFVKKSLKKEMLAINYLRLLYFNKSKFEHTLLYSLNNIINRIYNKKIEFNIVNLKYLYLNSDIYSQLIATKLKNRKIRLLRVMKSCMSLVKIPKLNKFDSKYDIDCFNIKLDRDLKTFSSIKVIDINKDVLHQLLSKAFNNKSLNYIENRVLNSVKYKPVTGVRVEVSGRLSRRFTASRSLFKFRYKGSLENIDSSHKGLSSTMLRGHVKSNIQYTKLNSKTRNGSFGLKGWISSE